MRIKEHELLTLVKRLSKAEKRYFKLYELQDKGADYALFFEFLDSQTQYNKTVIKAFLDNKFPKSSHSSIRSYLSKKLLETVSRFAMQKSKSKYGESFLFLRFAKMLVSKGLQEPAFKFLDQGEGYCDRFGFLDFKMLILDFRMDYMLFSNLIEKDAIELYGQLYERHLQLQKDIARKNEFKYLYARVIYWSQWKNYSEEELRKFEQQPLLVAKPEGSLFMDEFCYYKIHSMLAFFRHDHAKVKHYEEQIYNMWVAQPHMQQQFSNQYFISFYCYLESLVHTKLYDRLEELLPLFKNLHKSARPFDDYSAMSKALQVVYYESFFIKLLIERKASADILAYEEQLSAALLKHARFLPQLPSENIFQVYLYGLLTVGAYEKIQEWTEKTEKFLKIDLFKNVVKRKIFLFYHLLVNHQQNNAIFLASELKRISYRYKKEEETDPEFEFMLRIFQEMQGKKYAQDPNKVLSTLGKGAEQLKEQTSSSLTPSLAQLMSYWLKKESGVKFSVSDLD